MKRLGVGTYLVLALFLASLFILGLKLYPLVLELISPLPREAELRELPQIRIAILEGWTRIRAFQLSQGVKELWSVSLFRCGLTVDRGIWLPGGRGLLVLAGDRGRERRLFLISGETRRCPSPLPIQLKGYRFLDLAGGPVALASADSKVYLVMLRGLKDESPSLINLTIPPGERPRYITSLRGEEIGLMTERGTGQARLYLFRLRDDKAELIRVMDLRRRVAFPEMSPDRSSIAFLIRWAHGFNLGIMSGSRLRQLTHLPPDRLVWMRPIFLRDDELIVASDYKGGFRTFIVDLRSEVWHPLPLPSGVMTWPLDAQFLDD